MNHLGRALLEYTDPPVQMLFVYNCNPLATVPDQTRVLKGLEREDLFTVVFEQVYTDTARYADVVLPAPTFLEQYHIAKGYGPISLQLVRPVIEPQGEARPNADVFSELSARLGLATPEDETETLFRITGRMPDGVGAELLERGAATPPYGGTPVQFVDVFPLTPDRKVNLFPEAIATDAPAGLYGYQPDPSTEQFPLALISPATEKSISSTLAELRERAAVLHIHPDDAASAWNCAERSRPRLQHAWRAALPGQPHRRHPPWHRRVLQGRVAPEHLQRLHLERAGARLAHRSRRWRVLQRRTGRGRAAGAALNARRARGSGFGVRDRFVEPEPRNLDLVAEEKNQIHARALDATLGEAVCGGGVSGARRVSSAQELRQLVLEHELGEAALPELLAEADEGLVTHLLAQRHAAGGLAGLPTPTS